MSASYYWTIPFNLVTVASWRSFNLLCFYAALLVAPSISSSLSANWRSKRCRVRAFCSSLLWWRSDLFLPSSWVELMAYFCWDISLNLTLRRWSSILISWVRERICSSLTFMIICSLVTLSSTWFLSLSRLSTTELRAILTSSWSEAFFYSSM